MMYCQVCERERDEYVEMTLENGTILGDELLSQVWSCPECDYEIEYEGVEYEE